MPGLALGFYAKLPINFNFLAAAGIIVRQLCLDTSDEELHENLIIFMGGGSISQPYHNLIQLSMQCRYPGEFGSSALSLMRIREHLWLTVFNDIMFRNMTIVMNRAQHYKLTSSHDKSFNIHAAQALTGSSSWYFCKYLIVQTCKNYIDRENDIEYRKQLINVFYNRACHVLGRDIDFDSYATEFFVAHPLHKAIDDNNLEKSQLYLILCSPLVMGDDGLCYYKKSALHKIFLKAMNNRMWEELFFSGVKRVISLGGKLDDATDDEWPTLLQIACAQRNGKLSTYLIQNGASVKNIIGLSPFDYLPIKHHLWEDHLHFIQESSREHLIIRAIIKKDPSCNEQLHSDCLQTFLESHSEYQHIKIMESCHLTQEDAKTLYNTQNIKLTTVNSKPIPSITHKLVSKTRMNCWMAACGTVTCAATIGSALLIWDVFLSKNPIVDLNTETGGVVFILVIALFTFIASAAISFSRYYRENYKINKEAVRCIDHIDSVAGSYMEYKVIADSCEFLPNTKMSASEIAKSFFGDIEGFLTEIRKSI